MNMLRSPYFLRVFMPIAGLIIITVGSSVIYTMLEFRHNAEKIALNNLESLREAKVSNIIGYLNDHLNQIRSLSASPLVAQAMKEINEASKIQISSSSRYRASMFDDYFHNFVTNWGYYDLFLITPEGDIAYSVQHESDFATNLLHGPYRETPLAQVFRQAIWFLQASNSGFERYEPSANRPAGFVAAPIINQGHLLGVLAFQINVEEIYQLLGDLTGLNNTGETVAGRMHQGKVQITIPLRFKKDTAFQYELPLNNDIALPIIRGTQGNTGHLITQDWRNIEVIATWEYLPHLKWGIVNKIDTIEAMQGLNDAYRKSFLVLLLALLCAFWVAFIIARRVVVPVTELSLSSRRFSAGEHSIRLPKPFPKNELGKLMQDINSMMDKVATSEHDMQKMMQELRHQNIWLDRKVAEKTERLTSVIRHAADGILTLDIHGQIELANPAACHIFDYGEESMLQLHISTLFSTKNPCDQVLHLFNHMQGSQQLVELEGVRSHGECFAMELSLSDMQSNETKTGNPVFLLMVRDISKAKQLREQLEHTQRLESLGVLAGGIAHDFNNLLTAIMGNAALAATRVEHDPESTEMLKNIENASEKAAQLCRQMLAYSGKGRFVVRHIHLNEMIKEMVSLLEVSIHKSTVLRLDLCQQSIPPIMGDEAQLQQVIMNLVINASEAMNEKSGLVIVRTGMSFLHRERLDAMSPQTNDLNEGYYISLEVADTGCGMNQDTQDHLFDPFYTTKFTGRGLGMSATQGIIRGHHGIIQLQTQANKGTTFTIFLPVAEDPITNPSVKEEPLESWQAEGCILVIDDEETIRATACMMLQKIGFSTLSANNGEQGMILFRRHQQKITAVLLDMTMPGLSGTETFQQLRMIDPDVTVILSSGYSEQEATSHFAGQGLSGFIQKPYSLNMLKKKLKKFLKI